MIDIEQDHLRILRILGLLLKVTVGRDPSMYMWSLVHCTLRAAILVVGCFSRSMCGAAVWALEDVIDHCLATGDLARE